LKNGKSIEEYVFCKAGGGNKSMLNIPENWGEVSLDCNNYVLKYDGYGLDTLIDESAVLKVLKVRYFLFAGNNEVNTFVTSKDVVLLDVTDSNPLNWITDLSQLTTAVSGIHITDEAVAGPSAKYILGNYKEWWANFAISFRPENSNTYITLREIGAVKPFTGQAYEDKYVQSNNVPITGSDWTLYYSCFEKDLPNITVHDSEVSEGTPYIEFSIDKDFNNDVFEYQVCYKTTVDGLTGNKLAPNISITCNQASKLELNSNDGVNNLSYKQFDSIESVIWVSEESDRHNSSSSDDIVFMVIPYTKGKYKIEINEFNYQ